MDNLGIGTTNGDAGADNPGTGTADRNGLADDQGTRKGLAGDKTDNLSIGIADTDSDKRAENAGTRIADVDGADNPGTEVDGGAARQVVVTNKACASLFFLQKVHFILTFFLNQRPSLPLYSFLCRFQ